MKGRLEIVYRTPKGAEVAFTSEEMTAAKALLMAEDLQKSGRLKQAIFIDRSEHEWTTIQLKAYLEEIKTEPHNITVYFDGGFDINTRKAGLGCVIYYEQNGKKLRIRKNALVAEMETNNEAEYAALHLAIQELELLGAHHLPVMFTGDSQVVINQLEDEWPVMEKELTSWLDKIEGKLKEMGIQPEYKLISRKNNQEADRLATQALNEVEVTSQSEWK
ncbi:reverse transcriptase-like protein [Virgibacillus halodenitrificans]|uniref:Reverse transcriptase-like protein n=1 Tax=Virgibacillus halodenitrificans TaxID=1482 RepID=A0ABR7VLF1_VIRHA|nr:reverse transcriptase-like protein [Virgibacillus halodenitrificans]MBD1222518.1 reverse transcriptase-like protein [Virgibacillus halodenitrificans]